MRKTSGVPLLSGHGVEQKTGFKRLPAINAASLVKAILLAATLWLTMAPASFAQSYDPDLGSGNIARRGVTYGGGFRGWGRGILGHRAEFRHYRAGHHRRYRAR